MDEKELGSIKGWFAGRLPDGWFQGVEVAVEDDQIVVIGALPETNLGSTPEEKEGAAAGRIAASGRRPEGTGSASPGKPRSASRSTSHGAPSSAA